MGDIVINKRNLLLWSLYSREGKRQMKANKIVNMKIKTSEPETWEAEVGGL